jgi:hypothetical protein
MRKIILALGAVAAVGLAGTATNSAQAQDAKVVIKTEHHDRGMHRGWRHHHAKVVVIKHRRHHDHD